MHVLMGIRVGVPIHQATSRFWVFWVYFDGGGTNSTHTWNTKHPPD